MEMEDNVGNTIHGSSGYITAIFLEESTQQKGGGRLNESMKHLPESIRDATIKMTSRTTTVPRLKYCMS